MSHAALLRGVGLVQSLALLGLVLVFARPRAGWSVRARLPVAGVAFVASAAHLLLITL